MRLQFPTRSAVPGKVRAPEYIDGVDATDVLEKWRTGVGRKSRNSWAGYDPANFRERLVRWSGAKVSLPADDDEILAAVVEALGPEVVSIVEDAPLSGFRGALRA